MKGLEMKSTRGTISQNKLMWVKNIQDIQVL